MLDAKIVGQTLREARINKKLSQEVISGLADIGRTHLSAIERGERRPTMETLFRMAAALDMPASELVRQIEEKMGK